MVENAPDIVLVDKRIEPEELARLVRLHFEDMVKYVVDVERRLAAVGGGLHADAEGPAQGNRGMLIADPVVRERVREITFALVGQGEPLP